MAVAAKASKACIFVVCYTFDNLTNIKYLFISESRLRTKLTESCLNNMHLRFMSSICYSPRATWTFSFQHVERRQIVRSKTWIFIKHLTRFSLFQDIMWAFELFQKVLREYSKKNINILKFLIDNDRKFVEIVIT